LEASEIEIEGAINGPAGFIGKETAGRLRQGQSANGPVLCGQFADPAASRNAGRQIRFGAHELLHQHERGDPSVGPAALEGQFAGVLRPSLPDVSDHHVLGDEHTVEDDLGEMLSAAIDERNRVDCYTGALHVDQEPAEPLMAGTVAGAAQRDHEISAQCVTRPHLGARQPPADIVAHGAGSHRCEVAAGIGFAHADAEAQLSSADAGKEPPPLLLGPETQQHRGYLTISHPVVPDRGTPAQEFLDDDKTVDGRRALAAVLRGNGHADPPLLSQQR